ncbi:MAG: 16S rRNA (uracil(1498)-N(3))-methyltransferase [Metamycoplasmataceae bacterium]
MNRFFVEKKEGNYFILSREILDHLKVIKIGDKEFISVFKEKFFKCRLEKDKAFILEELFLNNEYEKNVAIFISIIKIKNLEIALQKSVELGAKEIFLIKTEFTNKKYIDKIDSKKMIRFKEIIKNAAEQSFRNIIPTIHEPVDFSKSLSLINTKNKFIAHEKDNFEINKFLPQDISIFIGPEGGFSDNEIRQAKENSFIVFSLGKTILRAETATIKALSLINL